MKYKLIVSSVIYSDEPLDPHADHTARLWEGETSVELVELPETPKVLVKTIWHDQDEVIKMVMAEYDKIIRANDSPSWNTIRAVFMDSSGEQAWEVLETADDMGVVLHDDEGGGLPIWDALWDAAADYRKSLADDPRNIPSGNGEDT